MSSKSWNKVELIGNLTRDPEMRYTPQGTAVCTFSVATNRSYTAPDGERKEETDFHRIVAWAKLAEICSQLLKKGNKVFVSGRLQNRSWEDPQTHQTRYMTEVVIDDMILLTSRGGESGDYVPEINDDPIPARVLDEMPKSSSQSSESGVKEDKSGEEKPEKKSEKAVKEEIDNLDDLPF